MLKQSPGGCKTLIENSKELTIRYLWLVVTFAEKAQPGGNSLGEFLSFNIHVVYIFSFYKDKGVCL